MMIRKLFRLKIQVQYDSMMIQFALCLLQFQIFDPMMNNSEDFWSSGWLKKMLWNKISRNKQLTMENILSSLKCKNISTRIGVNYLIVVAKLFRLKIQVQHDCSGGLKKMLWNKIGTKAQNPRPGTTSASG